MSAYIYGIGSFYSCLATNIPESSGSYVTEVTGEHIEGRDNNYVKLIEIYGNKTLPLFPKNFTRFFPFIIGIGLTDTLLKTLYGDELNERTAEQPNSRTK
ncbi:hypothetical protein PVAND_015322 [Polypedilum vanderplanki]|uniref:Uncharacterized protein n=1 Tax=Polypedilum vanderplanki TaxID=319348 RepID=A0A9J6BCR8_POLVA|nr:hypothetical protein PVAND_015322 [Polypedilum vanderplanki]